MTDAPARPAAVPAADRLDALPARAAAAHPGRTAVTDGSAALTFAALDARVTAVAAGLRDLLGPDARGETVAVASVLHPDFATAYYATARAGHVVAVVNPLLPEAPLAHVLGLSRARVAVLDAVLLGRLATVRQMLPHLRHVVLLGGTGTGPAGGAHTTLDALAAAGTGGWTAPAVDLDDDVCVQFTSGTTGPPKAVRLTHRNLTVNAGQIAAAHLLDADAVTLNHLPTFHPMHLNSALHAAATQVLCPAPEPAEAVAAANRHRATHFYSLPVRLGRLAADPGLADLTLETVGRIASGGSALPAGAAARLTERFGVPVFQGYGLAETSPLTHSDDPEHPVHGSVGRVVAGTECRVVDVESRAVLPADGVGEVQLRGPQVMKGYLGGPAGTGLEPDGWLSTGDVGRIGADGRLHLVDRLKDVFKCDNFLVAPSEIEPALTAHPAVREAVVVDLPHEFSGAVAAALVVLADGPDGPPADPEALLAEAVAEINPGLPYYQRVRYATPVPAIPRSGNGKIQRRVLRDGLLARLGGSPFDPNSHGRPVMPAPLFTVINTFTLKDPAGGAEFERRFLDHVQWMRAQDGFRAHQAVRRTDQPEVYVNVGWWAAPEDFQKVMTSELFQSHAAEFHQVVDVVADPSMGAVRVDADTPLTGETVVVVEEFTVTGDAEAFVAAYRAYAEAAAKHAGFGHTDLARSLFARPNGYTAATRWADADAARDLRDGPEYAAVLAQADVTVHVTTPVAGDRA